MKKIIAMLGAVAMAACVQAGTVTWSCQTLKTPDAVGKFTETPLSGGLAYLLSGTADALTIGDSIKAGTFETDYAGSIIKTKASSATGAVLQAGIGSYASEEVSLYMVIFDAGTFADANFYMVSNTITQTFGASGNKTYNFTSQMPTEWAPIPEPTSGLLLLLGMAGLALRRKQA